ncbi:MAG: aminotransferase class I/II-fold pyridoxal phosphate-dependent enzyme, partial [Albidovulum sp.]
MSETFTGSFTQQEPIPEAGIEAALRVMRHGRLHRYNTVADEIAETALLEEEFAAFTGAKYCLAVASGGYAIGAALRAIGVGPGDRVLTNAFTLAPVPGAIAAVGARPVFVEVTEDLTIDLDDLAEKIACADARALLLSHMRGHICDMDRLMSISAATALPVIEDCAHTMGAAWRGTPSGRHGVIGCYSTQTYKHMNSGEGGLMVSDDPDLMARAIILSGSYMLYARHRAAPPPEAFEKVKYITPNVSGRMDNLRAAILRPQLADLPAQCGRWNALYRAMERGLADTPGLRLIHRPEEEAYVASSFQFLLPDWSADKVAAFLSRSAGRGVELKWFGGAEPVGFTSRHDSWRYAAAQQLPRT